MNVAETRSNRLADPNTGRTLASIPVVPGPAIAAEPWLGLLDRANTCAKIERVVETTRILLRQSLMLLLVSLIGTSKPAEAQDGPTPSGGSASGSVLREQYVSLGRPREGIVNSSLRVAPNCREVTYAIKLSRGVAVVRRPVDGAERIGDTYDNLGDSIQSRKEVGSLVADSFGSLAGKPGFTSQPGPESFLFSPDGERLAYIGLSAGHEFVVLDGIAGNRYLTVLPRSLTFSPDSVHFAYQAVDSRGHFLVVDGHEQKPHRDSGAPWRMTFSPNGLRTAAAAFDRVIVDGLESEEEYFSIHGTPVFSLDSKHVAYTATPGSLYNNGKRAIVVLDGLTLGGIPEPDTLSINLSFAHDPPELIYETTTRALSVVHFANGKHSSGPTSVQNAENVDGNSLISSPDGSRLAWQKWNEPVVDGVEQRTPSNNRGVVSRMVFSPDSKRFAFVVEMDGKELVTVDHHPQKAFESVIGSPVFSPDSKHLAYAAMRGDKCSLLVIDEKEGACFDAQLRGARVVFDGPTRVLTLVLRGQDFYELKAGIDSP